MSEEKQAEADRPKDAWGDPISDQRKNELGRLFDEQVRQPEWDGEDDGNPVRLYLDYSARPMFWDVQLTGADVYWLAERARLVEDILQVPDLHLEGAYLVGAHLEGAELAEAHLEGAHLGRAYLQGAKLNNAHLEAAKLFGAHLLGTSLSGAHCEGATLQEAHLEGASLAGTHLESKAYLPSDVDLRRIRRWISYFPETLPPADLRGAFFDSATDFTNSIWVGAQKPSVGPALSDVRWGGANLTVVNWEQLDRLQDEKWADVTQTNETVGSILLDTFERKTRAKNHREHIVEYQTAARAYRLLFVALRNQGMAGAATRYHYRAEVMDRKALWHRRRLGRWVFSWLLGTFAGYGDALWRLFATYFSIITIFAIAFWIGAHHGLGVPTSLKDVVDPFVLSVTSFHGRGLQPRGLTANDTVTALSGLEAVFGLLVEGIFIAAFTRRVTGN